MLSRRTYHVMGAALMLLTITACKMPQVVQRSANKATPESFNGSTDTVSAARLEWKEYFSDPYLTALIDTALKNNQELNITMQEIQISQNEVSAKKGEYLPFVDVGVSGGADKVGRYTSRGASEATTDIQPGREMPDPVPDVTIAARMSWEIDIWRKLRNAKDAAVQRYLASVEGRNFMVTNLIAEIANSYYELLALDNQLEIVTQNIEIQSNALRIVKIQKQAARVTELAVKKFEAEVLGTKSLKFEIQQQIIETENRINFLIGRFPQHIDRDAQALNTTLPDTIHSGLPSQLLENRPDIRQAELQLAATKLDVKVAKANFYPSLDISAAIGLQAFNPVFLVKAPESILASLAGDLMAPIINRKAIKAEYKSANARQLQAVYNYERAILNGYVEVANQLSNINNLEQSYDLKEQEVQALNQSIKISNDLFKSARADYMEVLMTQRDALESKFELIETRKKQLNAMVDVYRALGGGWN